jgi:hypothetical protein
LKSGAQTPLEGDLEEPSLDSTLSLPVVTEEKKRKGEVVGNEGAKQRNKKRKGGHEDRPTKGKKLKKTSNRLSDLKSEHSMLEEPSDMGEASVGSPFTAEISIKSDNDGDSDIIPLSILRGKTEDEVSRDQDAKMEEQPTTIDEVQGLPDVTLSDMSMVEPSTSLLNPVASNGLMDRVRQLEEENARLKEEKQELEEKLQYYVSNYPPTSANSSHTDLITALRSSSLPAQRLGTPSDSQETRHLNSASNSAISSERPSGVVALLQAKDNEIEKLQTLLDNKNTEILKLKKEQNLSSGRSSSHRASSARIVNGEVPYPGLMM